jgi:exopolysaccharide biosynthesis polyprenyl glycosylphosphotransferase
MMTGVPSPIGGASPAGVPGRRLHLVRTDGGAVHARPIDSRASRLSWERRYRRRLRVTDAAAIAVALVAALIVQGALVAPSPGSGATTAELLLSAVIGAAWFAALAVFRTRDPHVVGAGAMEYKRVINATATAFGLVAIWFLAAQYSDGRLTFVVALPLGAAGLLIGRWSWRRWLRSQRRFGHYLARAMLVGSRVEVEHVAAQIARDRSAGYAVVGAVCDHAASEDLVVGDQRIPIVAPADGDPERVAATAERNQIDSVIVAGRFGDDCEAIRRLGWSLEGTDSELVLSSQLTDVAGPRIHFRPVEGLPLLHVEIPTFEGWRHVVKRTFDVVFASAVLLMLAPVYLLIAMIIRHDDGGPALFRQTRCGRDGRTFQMWKFRSMVPTAERELAGLLDRNEASGLLFKMRSDPRVTRVGRVLRAHSLDELPQFWNVLVGDMSVVGPRPPLVTEVESYDGPVRRRLMIKPGVTGIWQVSGRSDLSWEEGVRLDLYYVENWSLTGDLMILWRTVQTILRPKGAY